MRRRPHGEIGRQAVIEVERSVHGSACGGKLGDKVGGNKRAADATEDDEPEQPCQGRVRSGYQAFAYHHCGSHPKKACLQNTLQVTAGPEQGRAKIGLNRGPVRAGAGRPSWCFEFLGVVAVRCFGRCPWRRWRFFDVGGGGLAFCLDVFGGVGGGGLDVFHGFLGGFLQAFGHVLGGFGQWVVSGSAAVLSASAASRSFWLAGIREETSSRRRTRSARRPGGCPGFWL